MVLDQLAAVGGPRAEQLSPAEARQGYELFSGLNGPRPELASVVDDKVDGPAGPIPVRIYTPAGDAPQPIVVFFHGGGWTLGSISSHDTVCRQLADGAGAVVVSVDYRLAPEHPYPAARDDAYAATVWAAENADRLGADPSRLAVAGDSAGGNLAAVVALLSRDRGGPSIAFQLLVYPAVDFTMSHPSITENGEGYILTKATMEWFRANYLGPDGDVTDPYASPLLAPDLSGLPPALVLTGEFDPLRDEGEAYAVRLAASGVEAKASRYDGLVHTFFGMGAMWPRAADAMTEATTALRTAFGQR